MVPLYGTGGDGGCRLISPIAAANKKVQGAAATKRRDLRRPCGAYGNLASEWRRGARHGKRFCLDAWHRRRAGNKIHVAGLRAKAQERVFECGKGTGVEEGDNGFK